MSYDGTYEQWRARHPAPLCHAANAREAISSVLEVAAIFLTEGPDSSFTEDELLAKARELAADELAFTDCDARSVLRDARFVDRDGERLRLR